MLKRPVIIVGTGLATAIAVTGLYVVVRVNAADYKARHTIQAFHVPRGYTGWVTIRYRVPGAPPIPFQSDGVGGTYTFKIPPSGLLETSSELLQEKHTRRVCRAGENGEFVWLEDVRTADTHMTWTSSGTFNEHYSQFYVFDRPVGLWEPTPTPTGGHVVK